MEYTGISTGFLRSAPNRDLDETFRRISIFDDAFFILAIIVNPRELDVLESPSTSSSSSLAPLFPPRRSYIDRPK